MKNRIKELRQKNNLTLRALGEKINMSSSRLSQYETGKREPKLETWQKLASFFHVSVPYLQGFININIPNDLKFESKQDAIDCIERIMKAQGISKEDLRTEHENELLH